MSSSILYNIMMGTGLALSVDPKNANIGGHLVLEDADASSALQQWTWIFYPGTQASILYNPHLNGFAAPSSLDKGAPLAMFNAHGANYSGGNTWQVFDGSAVRIPANTDLNMNAFGDSWGPGTTVGLYTWDGGAPNERWTSKIISHPAAHKAAA